MSRLPRRRTNRQIFAIPAVLAVLGIVGLVSALVGDGVWDALSWITLGIPVAICGYYLNRPKSGSRGPP